MGKTSVRTLLQLKIPAISLDRGRLIADRLCCKQAALRRNGAIFRITYLTVFICGLLITSMKTFAAPSQDFTLPIESQKTKEQQERTYWEQHKQTVLQGLETLYTADDFEKTQIQLPSFTAHGAGADGGYGLHVVKRWKNVIVNEHWPVIDGRLSLPDEVRVRVESENTRGLPIYARLRIIWKPIRAFIDGSTHPADRPSGISEPFLFLEPQYSGNMRTPRRTPISTLDCLHCHGMGRTITQARGDSGMGPRSSDHGFTELVQWTSSNHSHFPRSFRLGTVETVLKDLIVDHGPTNLRVPNFKEVVVDLQRGKRQSGLKLDIEVLASDKPSQPKCFASEDQAMNYLPPAWSSPYQYLSQQVVQSEDSNGGKKWCRNTFEDQVSALEQEWRRLESAYNWWSGAVADQNVACYSPIPAAHSGTQSYCR